MTFKPIKSSNLVEARHKDGKVQVRFKNGLYESKEKIPDELYKKFESTFQVKDSSGSFFHKHLKKYDFKKVSE